MYRKKVNGEWVVLKHDSESVPHDVILYGVPKSDLEKRKTALIKFFSKESNNRDGFDVAEYYKKYLKSEWWVGVRNKILSSNNKCIIDGCKNTDLQLHHMRYDRLGTIAEHQDIICVCSEHHKRIHVRVGLKENKGKALLEISQRFVKEKNGTKKKSSTKKVKRESKPSPPFSESRTSYLLDIMNK